MQDRQTAGAAHALTQLEQAAESEAVSDRPLVGLHRETQGIPTFDIETEPLP